MENKIIQQLKKLNGKPISFSNLFEKLNLRKRDKGDFANTIDRLVKQGTLKKEKHRFVLGNSSSKPFIGEIVKLSTSFGFAKPTDESEKDDYFIPGHSLLGAMVGDKVLLEEKESFGSSPEAIVKEIIAYGESTIIGVLEIQNSNYYIYPDKMAIPLLIRKESLKSGEIGDKIQAKIIHRGKSHFDHIAEVIKVYGSGDSAAVAKEAILDEYGIPREFAPHVIEEAKILSNLEITQKQKRERLDLTKETIFTIDGEDAKDLDDAISLEKVKGMYKLGVHIADVSYFVKPKGSLDDEAYNRGTSTYFADEVIPMLPESLSNGICSLTPGEERLAFSVFMDIDSNGNILKYNFFKSIINSKIKGVYNEVNDILDKNADKKVLKKYDGLVDIIFLMKELSDILEAKRRQRGTFDIESNESKIITDEKGNIVDIVPRKSGFGEGVIESFMLSANEAAASFAIDKEIPFIHRVHENPSPEKINELKEDLKILGLEIYPNADGTINHSEFNRLLNETKGTSLETVINYRVLRTMAKAKYSEKPIGHFGLALEKYVHFTSPIRRYPDLVDHRILTEYLLGGLDKNKEKSFASFVEKASKQSSSREIISMSVERDCEDVYKAEYLNNFLGEAFDGIIVSATHGGVYVELENTIQGRIAVETLSNGEYILEGNVRLRNTHNNITYSVGDSVRIVVARTDVNTGNIDFILEEFYEKNIEQKKD